MPVVPTHDVAFYTIRITSPDGSKDSLQQINADLFEDPAVAVGEYIMLNHHRTTDPNYSVKEDK